MGAYLSEPITKKFSSDETGENVACGASSMQGWRVSQEDAHNCCIKFDENSSLFAVYDGHGGHEVAHYCSKKLPDFIKETEAYKRGDIRQALIEAFIGFDATLIKPEIISILKEIAGTKTQDGDKNESCDSDEDEADTITNLRKEAEMPLEQVMAKYVSEPGAFKTENCLKKGVASPYLRCRRAKDKGPSCSGSSTSWGTNEADVSSSSSSSNQACASTSGTNDDKVEIKNDNKPTETNDEEQVLHSTTTSNGEVSHSQDKNDKKQEAGKSELPDSSEDVKDQVSSKNEIKIEAEINGKEKLNCDADSSKVDGVSSSCTSLENGEAGQQESISSSARRTVSRKQPSRPIISLVDSSDDDEDEDDKNFDGLPDDDDDSDDVGMDDDDDDDDDDDEDDDDIEDDDDSMDDEDYEDEYDNDGNNFTLGEEPGADSGCTAVVALLHGQDLYVANAGDSRCVLCRDGEALELSLDHKPEDTPEMERIVKAGGKVTADGRVNGGLNLSRAIGDHSYKQNTELPPEEQMISALPDVRHVTIDPKRDEFLILACDGIWNFMTSSDVVQFVKSRINEAGDNISKICEELFDHCLSPDTTGDGTGCDNMTAVIVKFKNLTPITKNNAESDEVTVVKKRRASTSPEKDESVTNDKPIEDNKRAKVETI